MKTEDTLVEPSIVLDDTQKLDQILKLLDQTEHGMPVHIEGRLNQEISDDVVDFIRKNSRLCKDACVALLRTSDAFNVESFPPCTRNNGQYELAVNLKPINDTRLINKLFKAFNDKLVDQGTFVGCVETYQLRKRRLLKKFPKVLNWMYYTFDYIFKRVFPKIKFLDRIYFFVTAGRNRAISGTETLGRLYYCGFRVNEVMEHGNLMYFAASKTKEVPVIEEKVYRIFLRLARKGKNGKMISVFKLRTMFPYSEYLQEYIYERNKLKTGGKFQNDFRISLLGQFFRKYFLDEIPMLINLIKGDLKLVGVRPLSNQYFSLYTKELQQQRLKHKPGLIPPFYVDMPNTLEEIQGSEKKYLDAYEKAPFKTDIRYFFLAFRNILFKKARSK